MLKRQNCCPWCGGHAQLATETCDNCGESMRVPTLVQVKPVFFNPVFRTVRDKGIALEGERGVVVNE